ncbi:MAG: PaaI family thioesterase [Actinobacteria bacterium]|nr:PaaI family thioesterase [Actinomycetota bacterium]
MPESSPEGNAAPSPSQFPLAVFLGMTVETTGYGTARAEVTIDERHLNPNGVAHGSVVFTLADTSMGAATMSILDDGLPCSTIDTQVRYLRAAGPGRLAVETTIVKPGKRIVHLESRAVDQQGRLVATATGSYAVLGN